MNQSAGDLLRRYMLVAGDGLWGWTLILPHDFALFCLAGTVASLMLIIRRIVSDCGALRTVHDDQRRLRALITEGKRTGDVAALRRHRLNRGRIAWQRVLHELPALAASLPVCVLVAVWGTARLDRLPIPPKTAFVVRLEQPHSALGSLVHLVPVPGVQAQTGWIQQLDVDPQPHKMIRSAAWTLRGEEGIYSLTIRTAYGTITHPLMIGGTGPLQVTLRHQVLENALDSQPSWMVTIVEYPRYVPSGMRWLLDRRGEDNLFGVAPWAVALLVQLIPFYFGGKQIMRIS